MWLAANSSWKGQSDKAKYEKARELKKHISKVRADYTQGMASGSLDAQQRSVAVVRAYAASNRRLLAVPMRLQTAVFSPSRC